MGPSAWSSPLKRSLSSSNKTPRLCVSDPGESGLGKSTLVNSLFLTDLHKDRKLLNAEGESSASCLQSQCVDDTNTDKYPLLFCFVFFKPKERINQTVEITKNTVDIEEKGVKLKLTIVDTPGFGDAVNNTEWWVVTLKNII